MIPALITRLRDADYADDRDEMLAEAQALVKTGQFDKVSAGANIYLHLLEHNVRHSPWHDSPHPGARPENHTSPGECEDCTFCVYLSYGPC